MLKIRVTTQFKKDLKRIAKQGLNLQLLQAVVDKLALEENLPQQNKDHPLLEKWEHFRECHIQPDWLLIYIHDVSEQILTVSRTGSHSQLF